MTYEHKDWPRDLVHRESGKRREFKCQEDVPPGWFTVDGEEVNPAPVETVEVEPAKKTGKPKRASDTSGE